jgi:hypothetical protein
MRKIQKFSAAVIVAAVMASGTIFTTPVYASGGSFTYSASYKASICASIEKTEAAVSASTNPFIVKYLTAILAGLEKLEMLIGGCAS